MKIKLGTRTSKTGSDNNLVERGKTVKEETNIHAYQANKTQAKVRKGSPPRPALGNGAFQETE